MIYSKRKLETLVRDIDTYLAHLLCIFLHHSTKQAHTLYTAHALCTHVKDIHIYVYPSRHMLNQLLTATLRGKQLNAVIIKVSVCLPISLS